MKILFLNHNPEGYGTYFRCYHLARHLAARGHEITLLCASREPTLSIRDRKDGNLTIRILPRVNLATYHTGHTLRMFLNARECLTRKMDILHAFAFPLHPISLPTLLTSLARPKVKIVLDHDDMWKGGFTLHHPAPVRAVYDFTEDKLPAHADMATAASAILMQKFRDAGLPEEKIHYIPNCPTVSAAMPDKLEARAALGLPPDANMVLSMGHTYTESLFALLDAYATAHQSIPDLKLYFLGKLHISDAFKARMAAYEERFAPDIVKVGEKPSSEVPTYLAAADALLLPMDDDPIEKARFPIRFGDYLASGVPVVSNAVGEIKRIMETRDCGYTAPVDDPAAFGQAIVTALTDTADRQRKLDNAHRLIAEELNWPAVAARLEAIYEQTLAG
jgi:glycosyltransferase involved in cell wall biosynthesis